MSLHRAFMNSFIRIKANIKSDTQKTKTITVRLRMRNNVKAFFARFENDLVSFPPYVQRLLALKKFLLDVCILH